MNQYLIAYLGLGLLGTVGMLLRMKRLGRWSMIMQWFVGFLAVYPIWPIWLIFNVYGSIIDHQNIFRCAWCHELVDSRDKEAIREHVEKCGKHPLLNRIHQMQKIIDSYITIEAAAKLIAHESHSAWLRRSPEEEKIIEEEINAYHANHGR